MLKFTFEGADLSEVLGHIEKFTGNIAGGATAAGASGNAGTTKKKTVEKPKEEKITLDKVQLLCSSKVEGADDAAAMKGAIKEIMEEFMVKSVTKLEEAEYQAFYDKVNEL